IHNNLKPCPTGLKLKCLFKHKRDYNILIYLSMLLFFYQRNFLLKRIVNCFIAPSPQLKNYLDKNGFKNVKFIPNIINIKENIKPNFNKINYNQILYLGQLEKNKGVHILIKEMKYVVKKHPNILLKIAGSGSEKDNLIKLANKLNLNKNIQFLGWVDEISELIQKSAFLIVPSIGMEQFGLVTFESMAYFRPIIGSNRGATPWLIGKNCGLLFDPLKKKDLSKNILSLLKNKQVIQKKGIYAREKYLTFPQKDELIRKILNLYYDKV
ncbi:MAG: glycosyltransferase family 4 protein, partial [Nanoarchaeota archaeon]|nr:glycosyltransferase family 4 protein [Nanoarchaeota archaeon]